MLHYIAGNLFADKLIALGRTAQQLEGFHLCSPQSGCDGRVILERNIEGCSHCKKRREGEKAGVRVCASGLQVVCGHRASAFAVCFALQNYSTSAVVAKAM
jgi:hypothetical protein